LQSDKLKILSNILGRYYASNDEYLFACPKCKHYKKKLSINLDKGVYKCWICDYSGLNLSSLVKRYGDRGYYSQWLELDEVVDLSSFDALFESAETEDLTTHRTTSLPEDFFSLTKKMNDVEYRKAMNYLSKRNISYKDIVRWRIGFCRTGEYEGRVCIPSFDERGDLSYFIARSYKGGFPKYKNPPVDRNIVFNELYINWDEPVVLVEGVFDAIVAGNALPLLGSTLSERSQVFKTLTTKSPVIYVALDSDASKKEMRMIKLLLQYDLEVYKIDTTGVDDVGSMTKEEFLKRKEEAVLIDQTNYLYQCLSL
jgi:DNA primase